MALKPEVVSGNVFEEPLPNLNAETENSVCEAEDVENDTEFGEMEDVASQLEYNVAALFLKMSLFHKISEIALQEVIEQINQIYLLSRPLLHSSIREVLNNHCGNADDSLVNEIVKTVTENNVFLKCPSTGGLLSTATKRTSCFVFDLREFLLLMPVDFVPRNDQQTVVYVPFLKMLQTLLSNRDILNKAMSTETILLKGYKSYRDGFHFKENSLLTDRGFKSALFLYTDDFEVAKPLGTSRNKHKVCAIYLVLSNLHTKFRSSLHSIQLALLCKVNNIKKYGFGEIVHPLIQGLVTLEQHGVYVEHLADSIKGTVLFVAADHLAAHSLGGFFESFSENDMCRFCMAKREEIQYKEVRTGSFQQRTKENYDKHVQDVLQDASMAQEYGEKLPTK